MVIFIFINSNISNQKMEEQHRGIPWRWILYGCIGLYVISGIFRKGDSGNDYIEETLEEPTQGIIVELKETEENLFKITNEEIIEQRELSQIIANFLDGTVDTFGIDEVKLMEANDPRRSMLRTAAYAGLFGYMMGRPMGSGVARSAYASDGAYNKSNSGRNALRSTARKTTVRRPASASKGYGSGKSSKSYGG